MLSELGQLLLRRCAAIGGDGVDHRPIECKQISPRNGGDWLKTSWVAKPGWSSWEVLPVGEQDDIKSLEIFQFCPIAFSAGIGGFLELSVRLIGIPGDTTALLVEYAEFAHRSISVQDYWDRERAAFGHWFVLIIF